MEQQLSENEITLRGRYQRLLGTFATRVTYEEAHNLYENTVRTLVSHRSSLNDNRPQVTGWANPIVQWQLNRRINAVEAFRDTFDYEPANWNSIDELRHCYAVNEDIAG